MTFELIADAARSHASTFGGMVADAVRTQPVAMAAIAAVAIVVAALFCSVWWLIGQVDRLHDRADINALFTLQLHDRQDSTRKSLARVAKEVKRLRDAKGRFVKAA